MSTYRIGNDIGGTFTDTVILNDETGKILLGKVLTTPENPAKGTIESISTTLMKQNGRMQDAKHRSGCTGQFYIMLSNGGIAVRETAERFPVRVLESGPSGGVLAAAFFGELIGEQNLLFFDMGGTIAMAGLIENGCPMTTIDFEVAREHRFKQGSGFPIKLPAIDLIEIGAGGGSIAHINQLGLLKVGPESAGAYPGPACYGLGGKELTVTDANLLLGHLNPDYFWVEI